VNTVDGKRGQTHVLRTCEPQRSIHDRVPVEGSTRTIHQGLAIVNHDPANTAGYMAATSIRRSFAVLATGDGSIYAARRRTSLCADGLGSPIRRSLPRHHQRRRKRASCEAQRGSSSSASMRSQRAWMTRRCTSWIRHVLSAGTRISMSPSASSPAIAPPSRPVSATTRKPRSCAA